MTGKWRGRDIFLSLAVLVILTFTTASAGLAVMSIDLGSEFMKIAIVKPGVPMEIALNKESRRKTPTIVAMRDGERLFSDPAMTTAVKYPAKAYWYLQDLLGKSTSNPAVKLYQERFPFYKIENDEATNMPVFRHDEENTYSPEELFAMILENAKLVAGDFAEQPISDAVITVPPFFNQAERRALLRAAEMAGIKVLQLMNDNTAVALNYGVFRRKVFNSTAVHYMFYDMGASSTTATIVSYQVVKTKNPVTGIAETNPQLTVKGVGFERNLGGMELQLRLRDHLAKLFTKQKKTSLNVYESPRAMAKLFKEAGRLKNVLSANQEHFAQIEGLLDDEDFKAKVTRAEFEEMCEDVFARVGKPVKDALKTSGITMDELSEVILMGGGTRVPLVQQKLMEVTGRTELGKSINTDEAAALGGVYQAAHLSKGFKVLKFGIKDANIYPIQVEFERVRTGEESADASKIVKRMLFGATNPYPQKKVMTFNKHVKDFTFDVTYADLGDMTEEQLKIFGNTVLQKVSVTGVEDAFNTHSQDALSKGIKAHFRMDDSGILHLDKVESVFEKAPEEEEEPEKEESTLQKLGNFFFGGDKKEETEGGVDENQEENTATEDTASQGSETDSTEEKSSGKEEDKKEETESSPKKEEEKDTKKEKSEKDKEKDDKEAENSKKEEKDDKKKSEKKEKAEEPTEEKEKSEKKADKKDKDEKTDEDKDKKDEKDEKSDKEEKKEEEKEEKKKEKKPRVVKLTLESKVAQVDLPDPSPEHIKASEKKLAHLKEIDEAKKAVEAVRNEIETVIFNNQDNLGQDDYISCTTEEERDKAQSQLAEASDWLYDQDEFTELKAYKEKLKDLKKLMRDPADRVKELRDRPRAQEALASILNYTETFLVSMANYTGEDLPFTEVEATTLEKLIITTKEWNHTVMTEQAATPLTEKPKVTVEDLAHKIADLDREVKYLINKAKTFKPKVKDTDKETKKTKAKKDNETVIEEKEEDEEKMKEDDEKVKEDSPPEGEQVEAPPTEETEQTEEQEPLEIDLDVKEAIDDTDVKKKKEDKSEKSKTEKSSKKTKKGKHDPDDEL